MITTLILGMGVVSSCSESKLDTMTRQGQEISQNIVKITSIEGLESEVHALLMNKQFARYHRLSMVNTEQRENTIVRYMSKGVYSVYNRHSHNLTIYRVKQ